MPFSAHQLAAMRFTDAEHGLIVVSSSPYGKPTLLMTFQTVPVAAGPVHLSHDGSYLTVISAVYPLMLLSYEE